MTLTLTLLSLLLAQPDQAAEQLFEKMRQTLAQAKTLECKLTANAKGNVEYQLQGSLLLTTKTNQANFYLEGTNLKIKVGILSDGVQSARIAAAKSYYLGAADRELTAKILAALAHSGLAVGSPLYQASSAKDTPLQGYFKATGFKLGGIETVSAIPARVLTYTLKIQGQDEPCPVTVWIDEKTSLPVKRTITTKSAALPVNYVETYTTLKLDGALAAADFVIPMHWQTPWRDGGPKEKHRLPKAADVTAFTLDPPEWVTGIKMTKITIDDVKKVLATYKVVTHDEWLNCRSHVAMLDQTGTITLASGTKLEWFIRPGGLAMIKLPDNTHLYLISD